MSSTIDRLKNSLGFGKQIDDLKDNETPEVDSIAELHSLILSGETRITQLEQLTDVATISGFSANTNTRLESLETFSGQTNSRLNDLESNTGSTTNMAFSPMNVAVCDLAPTAASTQYYYQTVAEISMTISNAKMWGYSGSNLVLVGIYRGKLGGTMTLIGQGSKTCGMGPNEITLTAETGQNLTLTAGEDLVVGYYANGTSWRTVYDVGISDMYFGILNSSNITTMPSSPTGTATNIRFALTLY